ncbi:PREDICTED: myrosinase-binding protein 2-like [Wasmannia auropunctata]|uniref:myrosinase-binding protein 2-like n=1 Tax=Wasmannia auropunctata TaxID=64793 RepID=UPI0005EF484B|nr:PREDICTED: myrosinase-binding protein 2-like [Wasmannia auropunctata]
MAFVFLGFRDSRFEQAQFTMPQMSTFTFRIASRRCLGSASTSLGCCLSPVTVNPAPPPPPSPSPATVVAPAPPPASAVAPAPSPTSAVALAPSPTSAVAPAPPPASAVAPIMVALWPPPPSASKNAMRKGR